MLCIDKNSWWQLYLHEDTLQDSNSANARISTHDRGAYFTNNFHSLFAYDKNMLIHFSDPQIIIYYCICHDSIAIVSCAAICSEQLNMNRIWAEWNFPHSWIVLKMSLIKYKPHDAIPLQILLSVIKLIDGLPSQNLIWTEHHLSTITAFIPCDTSCQD